MPILRNFLLVRTIITDSSFDQSFENLSLPELVEFHIIGGKLTKVPKMFKAPKLRFLSFSNHNLENIPPFAFDLLPNLESLDLSGNNTSVSILKENSLAFTSSNFTKLGTIYFH